MANSVSSVDQLLFRALVRVCRRLSQAPLVETALKIGICRVTTTSRAVSQLQQQIISTGGSAALRRHIRREFDTPVEGVDSAQKQDTGFTYIRQLQHLISDMERLEKSGAFSPATERPPSVKLAVGQLVWHKLHDHHCVIYGWDTSLTAREPTSEDDLNERLLVDNREFFTGIETTPGGSDEPHFRTLFADGSAHLCAQSLLEAVPTPSAWLNEPIQGSSFFFDDIDRTRGCYRPNPELSRRYPYDDAILTEAAATPALHSTAESSILWGNSWQAQMRR